MTLELESLWAAHHRAVRGYARLRVGEHDAEDVVIEVFTVAWRRITDVPACTEQQRSWLFGVARKVLSTAWRGQARSNRLSDRIRAEVAVVALADDPADVVIARISAVAGFLMLAETDRELLWSVAWAGSTRVVASGCSRSTTNVRLHRARRRLETAIDDELVGGAADYNRSASLG